MTLRFFDDLSSSFGLRRLFLHCGLRGPFSCLEELHANGALPDLCLGTDHTFNVEWHGYARGLLGAAVHRHLHGVLRKSVIPLIAACRPRERKANCALLFQRARSEATARGLPIPSQVSCDYFGGIGKAFARASPKQVETPAPVVVTSLWHLCRNLTSNQGGQKKRKCRSPKCLGGPSAQ